MAEIMESRCAPALILGKSRTFSRDAEVIADVQAPTSVRSYADYFASARDSFWIGGSALVVKTVELRHAGCFTQERIIADDLDVCLRVGDRKGFVAVDCPLTFAYRQHSQNVSNSLDRLLTSIHYLITEEQSAAYAGGQTRQNARRRIICRHARPWAIAAAKSGRMRSAWDLFRRILPWCIREGRAPFYLWLLDVLLSCCIHSYPASRRFNYSIRLQGDVFVYRPLSIRSANSQNCLPHRQTSDVADASAEAH